MGSSWSAQPNNKVHQLTIDRTAIHSKPIATFYDPLHISVLFEQKSHASLIPEGKTGRWQVDLEVDVAHLQARYRLLEAEAPLSERLHRIHIPESAFRTVANDDNVNIDMLCNISAIHADLFNEVNGGVKIAEATVVVDFGREGYDPVDDVATITRRVYGLMDMSRETT